MHCAGGVGCSGILLGGLLHSTFGMGCHGMSALHSVAPAKIPAARVTIIDDRMQLEDSSRSSVVFSAFSFLPSFVWTRS